MTLQDPFAAYNAGSNIEAHLVCGLLRDAGIPAVVIEDVSQVGVWIGGLIPEIHKPQVWIERADIERVRPILTGYEQRNAERRLAERGEREAEQSVEAVCEECGSQSSFPASQKGTTQSCPNCQGYIDVGDQVEFEGWEAAPGEDEA